MDIGQDNPSDHKYIRPHTQKYQLFEKEVGLPQKKIRFLVARSIRVRNATIRIPLSSDKSNINDYCTLSWFLPEQTEGSIDDLGENDKNTHIKRIETSIHEFFDILFQTFQNQDGVVLYYAEFGKGRFSKRKEIKAVMKFSSGVNEIFEHFDIPLQEKVDFLNYDPSEDPYIQKSWFCVKNQHLNEVRDVGSTFSSLLPKKAIIDKTSINVYCFQRVIRKLCGAVLPSFQLLCIRHKEDFYLDLILEPSWYQTPLIPLPIHRLFYYKSFDEETDADILVQPMKRYFEIVLNCAVVDFKANQVFFKTDSNLPLRTILTYSMTKLLDVNPINKDSKRLDYLKGFATNIYNNCTTSLSKKLMYHLIGYFSNSEYKKDYLLHHPFFLSKSERLAFLFSVYSTFECVLGSVGTAGLPFSTKVKKKCKDFETDLSSLKILPSHLKFLISWNSTHCGQDFGKFILRHATNKAPLAQQKKIKIVITDFYSLLRVVRNYVAHNRTRALNHLPNLFEHINLLQVVWVSLHKNKELIKFLVDNKILP